MVQCKAGANWPQLPKWPENGKFSHRWGVLNAGILIRTANLAGQNRPLRACPVRRKQRS
jgi:hypothetical protein